MHSLLGLALLCALVRASASPDISELPSTHTFEVLGMSVYDNPNDDLDLKSRWWKWFMPSFYKQNLKGVDVNFKGTKTWNDTSYCQVRYYGFVKKLGSEGYWDGGYGTLTVPQHDKPLKCFYQSAAQSHVNIGHGSKHSFEREQAAKQLMAFAIYCPLPKKRQHICEMMNTKTITSEIKLYPVGWEKTHMAYPPYVYLGSTVKSKKGRLELPQIKPDMQMHKATYSQKLLPSTEMMVCTVQTFHNEMSGPMLYMFASHYSQLGFQVVIFDRYGKHVEFIQELIDTYYVIYHPFTAYEIGFPSEYNAAKYKEEKGTFKFFYHFEVNDKFTVADDTRLQDQDKMITYDCARVQYSSYRIFLALDSDEILVPDSKSSLFPQFLKKHESSSTTWRGSLSNNLGGLFYHDDNNSDKNKYPPVGFKAYITKSLSRGALEKNEEIMLFRYSVAASTPTGLIHPKKLAAEGDMVTYTSTCLNNGYKNRDVIAMANCYSSTIVFDRRFVKFIDTQSTCAFHYLHNGCNLVKSDPPKTTTPDDVAGVDFGCFCSKRRTSLKGMYLLHLNHNNFCSKINRKKDPDELTHGVENPLLNHNITVVHVD